EEHTSELQSLTNLVCRLLLEKKIRTIYGVGPMTALAFVLLMNNDRSRFQKSRDVGCYIGLRPKRRASGRNAPQFGITSGGDTPEYAACRHVASRANARCRFSGHVENTQHCADGDYPGH